MLYLGVVSALKATASPSAVQDEKEIPCTKEDTGQVDRPTEEITQVTVVKKALNSVLRDDLPHGAKDKFLEYINSMTDTMSRMSRRASLMFLYYVTRLKEQGLHAPDFEAETDGYWKQWLWVGLEEYSDKMPSPDVRQYFDEVKDLLGTTINSDGTK